MPIYLASEYLVNSSSDCDSAAGHYIQVHGTPKANFTLDTNFACLGHRTKLTNTSSTGTSTVDYNWRMGDGFSSTQKAFDYTYSKTGTYPVRLSVSTPYCGSEASQFIHIGSGKGATVIPTTSFAGRASDGTALKPDQACVGDLLVYKVTPPTGFSNREYGSLWKVSSISWNRTGTTAIDSLTILPDTIRDFTVHWLADSTMPGDTLELVVEVASTPCSKLFKHHHTVCGGGRKSQVDYPSFSRLLKH